LPENKVWFFARRSPWYAKQERGRFKHASDVIFLKHQEYQTQNHKFIISISTNGLTGTRPSITADEAEFHVRIDASIGKQTCTDFGNLKSPIDMC